MCSGLTHLLKERHTHTCTQYIKEKTQNRCRSPTLIAHSCSCKQICVSPTYLEVINCGFKPKMGLKPEALMGCDYEREKKKQLVIISLKHNFSENGKLVTMFHSCSTGKTLHITQHQVQKSSLTFLLFLALLIYTQYN